VNKAPKFTPPIVPARFELLTAAQVVAQPPAAYLIKRTIPANSFGAFHGPSGSGKSFLLKHALHAISEGGEWFGLRTRAGLVLYIGLEGGAGIANRVRALRITGNACDNLRFMVTALDIRDHIERQELIDTIKASGLAFVAVAIDTLARSSPGADENSGQDMGQINAALTDIQSQLGVTVIAVHHSGKDTSKGPRGHSSFLAALDFAIEVRRDGDRREWQLVKAKDAADGEIHPFTLRVVELGEDEDGDQITSCVVHEMTADEQQPIQQAKSKKLSEVGGAIVELLTQHGSGMRKGEIVKHFDGRYPSSTIYRELKKLAERNRVCETAGIVALLRAFTMESA
jgi:hypothetical protein